MSSDQTYSPATRTAALGLIAQYGDDAEIIAVLRAAELAATGDVEGLTAWDEIIACIAAIEDDASVRGPLN